MILVTGATGNIGRKVVSQLIAARLPTRVFVRDSSKAAHWANRVELNVGDFQDAPSFARACEGVRSVLLIAVGTDVTVLSKLLDAMRMSGALRMVFISGSVANWPDSEIGALFRDRESVVKDCGLPWTILRPCDFMSNAYQWADAIKREGIVYNPLGNVKSALIAPEDIAAVAVKCLTSAEYVGQTMNLTGSEALSVPEQVEILSQALKRPIRCIEVSAQQAVTHLIQSGMPEISAQYVAEIYERERRGEAAKLTPDLVNITSRQPKAFREWVQDHADHFF